MKVRPALAEDLPVLAACDFSFLVTREAIPPFEGDWLAHARPVEPYPKSYGFDPTELAEILPAEDKALFVILGDETPVGYLALSVGWNGFAVIDDIAVDAEWRGTGAAQRLMQQARPVGGQKSPARHPAGNADEQCRRLPLLSAPGFHARRL